MRTQIVGGNWKMHTTRAEAVALARAVADRAGIAGGDRAQVIVFPPFVWLEAVAGALEGSTVALGAQDASEHANGAYTGEVSLAMLAELGVGAVLVGHSERRHVLGESDARVHAKLKAALEAGMTAVLCVGETLEQRDAGLTDAVNEGQLRSALEGLGGPGGLASGGGGGRLVIAYEPVWAIGTGRTATPEDAQKAHRAIRGVLGTLLGEAPADAVPILYGGSMKPENAADLMAQADVDGGLVGGASLKADDFAGIVAAAEP